jgi:hypothetical protein
MTLPSLFLAKIPQPAGHSLQVEANQVGSPVTMSNSASTKEYRVLAGWEVQLAANDKLPTPVIFRKVLRSMLDQNLRVNRLK